MNKHEYWYNEISYYTEKLAEYFKDTKMAYKIYSEEFIDLAFITAEIESDFVHDLQYYYEDGEFKYYDAALNYALKGDDRIITENI